MRKLAIGALIGLTAGLLSAPAAQADTPNKGPKIRLPQYVKVKDIRDHLQNLQTIARYNGGNRASGLPGGEITVSYIADQLERAGYDPKIQHFTFPFWQELSEPALEIVSPEQKSYEPEKDFLTYQYSGSGDVTATAAPVDTQSSTSGCEASDFEGFPAGSIALIKRGSCTFEKKAANAVDAGATAVIIYNDGASDSRMGPVGGTLGRPFEVPVTGPSHPVGSHLVELANQGELKLRIATDTLSEERTASNVIAETRRGRDGNVVMAGAHLDGVTSGPGINDNGSGLATVLTIAEQIKRVPKLKNKVRFAFWGAEEEGLLGSQHYVDQLSKEQRDRIALYLNFDMVGSANYVRFVYDGDNSLGTGVDSPAGSGAIEQVLTEYYANHDMPTGEKPFNGRSDYGPFIAVGIPSGGLSSGSDGVKTEKQAEIYGGTAGKIYAPCYHSACDDIDTINWQAIEELSNGAAYGVERFARSTLPVNGVELAKQRAKSGNVKIKANRRGDRWVR